MLSIKSIESITENAAMDNTPLFDWQEERTMESPYGNRNFRGTWRNYNSETQYFHETTREQQESINIVFSSELEEVISGWEKIDTKNDRRKNKKIARKTVWKIKDVLRIPRYMNYHPEAFVQNIWRTEDGFLTFQNRNPELPQLLYTHESFSLVKKIQDQLSEHLSYRDQQYIQSLPNSIYS